MISENDGTSNNTKRKNRKKYDIGKKYQIMSVKSSDTNTGVSNRIFIMSDSNVKDVRGCELSVKWKTAKFK